MTPRTPAPPSRRLLVGLGFVAALGLGALFLFVQMLAPLAAPHPSSGARTAVLEDEKGDRISVEVSNDTAWGQLVQMEADGTAMWVGGPVERYGNDWGFRFRPDGVNAAEITAEALQSVIRDISADVDYWIALGSAYVFAHVVEIQES